MKRDLSEQRVSNTVSEPSIPDPPNGQPEQPKTRVRTTTRGLDPEIQAMAEIDKILVSLDDADARCRIMCWLWDRNMHTDPPGAVQQAFINPDNAD